MNGNDCDCNNCVSCVKWSHDNTLFKCICFDILFNLHQILRKHNCHKFEQSEEELIIV